MECTRGKGKNTLATQDVVRAPLVFSGVHLTHGRSLCCAVDGSAGRSPHSFHLRSARWPQFPSPLCRQAAWGRRPLRALPKLASHWGSKACLLGSWEIPDSTRASAGAFSRAGLWGRSISHRIIGLTVLFCTPFSVFSIMVWAWSYRSGSPSTWYISLALLRVFFYGN